MKRNNTLQLVISAVIRMKSDKCDVGFQVGFAGDKEELENIIFDELIVELFNAILEKGTGYLLVGTQRVFL